MSSGGGTEVDFGLLILAARLMPVADVTGSSCGFGGCGNADGEGEGNEAVEIGVGVTGAGALVVVPIPQVGGAVGGNLLVRALGSVGENAGNGNLEASGDD